MNSFRRSAFSFHENRNSDSVFVRNEQTPFFLSIIPTSSFLPRLIMHYFYASASRILRSCDSYNIMRITHVSSLASHACIYRGSYYYTFYQPFRFIWYLLLNFYTAKRLCSTYYFVTLIITFPPSRKSFHLNIKTDMYYDYAHDWLVSWHSYHDVLWNSYYVYA